MLHGSSHKTGLLFVLLLLFVASTSAQVDGSNYLAGDEAGTGLTSGEFNTLVGDSTGFALTNATDNTLFGYRAGRNLRSNGNVHLGAEAGLFVTFESRQVLIGYQAGYQADANELTYIGARAGYNSAASPLDNTFVGHAAGCGNRTGDDNTYIGYPGRLGQ